MALLEEGKRASCMTGPPRAKYMFNEARVLVSVNLILRSATGPQLSQDPLLLNSALLSTEVRTRAMQQGVCADDVKMGKRDRTAASRV